jgi:hypothetical protein
MVISLSMRARFSVRTTTATGDLKMVDGWWRLSFVRQNPFLAPGDVKPTTLPPDQKYISVERTIYNERS